MKRFFLCVLIIFPCFTPILGQEVSEATVMEIMTKAFFLNQEGKYQEALEEFLIVGEYTKNQRTENERKDYVLSQTMAIMCYERLEHYQEGFQLSEQLLKEDLTEDEKTEVQHLYVMNGYFIATSEMLKNNRQYESARLMFTKILPLADNDMKKLILPKIPLSWFFEGMTFQLEYKYDEALSCAEEARIGFHNLGDIQNEIDAYCQIAEIKYECSDTLEAVYIYKNVADLARDNHYDAKLMNILMRQHHLSNLIGHTDLEFQVSIEIDSLVTFTDDNSIKFAYFNHKGNEAKNLSLINLSEQWYLKNEQYVKQLKEEFAIPDKRTYYSNLCDLYTKSGQFDEALKYAELCKQEFLRRNITNSISSYISFANIYKCKGDSILCYSYLDSLFAGKEKLYEPKEIALLYTIRARCHTTFKKYDQALTDYREADRILASKYLWFDDDRLGLLSEMGVTEIKLKHYDESELLFKKYADGMRYLHGENSNDYTDALYYLANAERFAGHIDDGCKHYSLSIEKTKKQIKERIPHYTQKEREHYWNSRANMLRSMTPFAIKAEKWQTSFTKDCYDGLVLSKSFLLESERTTYNIIKSNGNMEDLHDNTLISSMQAKIKNWERNYATNVDSILEISSKADALEKRLTGRCRSYGDLTSFMSIGYYEIKDKLKKGDVLIDFTDFISETNERTYAAYLVDNEQEYPLLQTLFADNMVDTMHVAYPDQYYEKPYAKTMYQLLWIPFKDKVAEGATVYYVPSQLLFQVALESIPTEDGTLLGEHYNFIRLSSARELVIHNGKLNIDRTSGITNAVLYGGLLYDMEAKDMAEEAKKYDVSSMLAFRGGIHRGDSIFRSLPGSKKEVDIIEKILRSHQLSVTSYTGKLGTEESFICMSGKSPQILHVATHGFFYTPTEAQKIDYLKGYEDAMSLSGLVMSGGNAAWRGKEMPDGVLGGILTAYNIARLDLNNTELAVLSACESGRGQATAEGLYGLQRAFKKAGVKTIIMSLWNVSDVVGTEFMNFFYEYLLDKDNHWDKRAAFNKAKTDIRNKYPKQPYYWACFVMLD